MYLEKNLEKKWIIKSENKILGPYSFDQIIDLLRKKQISIIDEVRDPETRWLYVRENNEFKNIVEEIRKEIDSRQESTKTFQSTTTSVTSATNANAITSIEDLGQKTKTDISIQVEEVTGAKEIEVINETPLISSDSPKIIVEKAKFYGVVGDSSVQTKITDYSKRLKIFLASFSFIVAASYVGYQFIQKRNIKQHEEELVSQVRRLKTLGLYDKAIEVYTTLPETAQKLLIPSLLDIYPILQKAGLMGAEDIKALKLNSNLSAGERSNLELVGFWLAAKERNFGLAQDYLSNAAKLTPTSDLIKENDAWLVLKSSQSGINAYKQFKSINDRSKNGRYLYGMVLSYLAIPASERAEYTQELLNAIELYTIVYFDLRKELLLAQIYLSHERGEDVKYKISLKQFFNTPTQLFSQFTKPSLLLPDTYSWKELDNLKTNVISKLSGDDVILFKMHDLLELGQLNEASNFLKNNQTKVSSPQVREQLNLLLLNAQGRSKEVLALAQLNILDTGSKLNHLIIALNQIKVDPKKTLFEHVSAVDNEEYLFYKEWIELEQIIGKGSIPELKNYLTVHFNTIENFSPLIEARNLVN